jgi:exodeoxyribonuclease III
VRIATWNVNSAKQRLPRLLPWLDERRPDVACLQETKLGDEAFRDLLGDELAARGYEAAVHGEPSWNGVAILSRVGLEDAVPGLDGAPGFPHPEARALAATCAGVRVFSVYVPNGREPGSDHYRYKLAWLAALRDAVAAAPAATVVCGDMNIAPADEDVFDPDAYAGHTHVTAPERAALAELQAAGLRDVVRDRWPGERVFTYWDYRAGMFHRDLGMRIDLVLAGAPVADRVRAAWVDRQARKGKRAERPRAGRRRPRRGPRRRPRPGGAAALGPGHQARRREAAAGAPYGAHLIVQPTGVVAAGLGSRPARTASSAARRWEASRLGSS